VAHDLLTQPTAEDARDHLLRGLRWLFGAVGLSSALYGYASMQPTATADAALGGALIGLLPGMLGLAHLLFSWLLRRRATPVAMARPAVGARAAIMRATVRPPARQALRPFRAAVRRF
jgi:hypothetical protein